MGCVRTVFKTFIFQHLVTVTFQIYTPYGKLSIDYGMNFMDYEKKLSSKQRDRDWSLMTPSERISSLRSLERQSLRVIGGMEDKSNEYPYVVALGARPKDVSMVFGNSPFSQFLRSCTGSLISEQWVLTAAHCSFAKPARIRYGNMTVLPNDASATYSNILKMLIHPNFIFGPSVTRLKNDIGMLLVDRVRLSMYGRVSAVDYRTLVGLPVKYVGLGNTNTSFLKDQTRNRQYGEAAVGTCPEIIRKSRFYPMLCLLPKCANLGQQTYHGDSGGPLLQAGAVVGVLVGAARYPGLSRDTLMYTAVSPFLDWIRTTMHTAKVTPER